MIAAGLIVLLNSCAPKKEINILVFSKTAGFRHESIVEGKIALLAMGQKHGFKVDTTEDATLFDQKHLKNYNIVVFLSTTGDVLNETQQLEFQRFIQAGGGFVGIHAAADTEYDWPWYGKLVGGYFESHPNNPNVREADIQRLDKTHISTKMLSDTWHRNDEWYNYKNINPDIKVLLNLDEKSYEGGTNGENHPIAWYHEYDGGRAWYTGGGHTSESFAEPEFLEHLWGGIQYVAGDGKPVNYELETVAPQESRFVIHTLDENLNEPMELVMLPDGKLLFVERSGAIKVYDGKIKNSTVIHRMNVNTKFEDGLLGVALDPKFIENRWIYFYYSDPKESHQNLSRFVMREDFMSIDTTSEKVLLTVKTQREECCHAGGSVAFDANGLLYVSTGDNTNPFFSDGFSPSDERPGRAPFDAQGSSANSNDLRGKILRVKPEADGTYSIPDGNLFPKDGSQGRPEIYVMGCRNPFRIAIDARTGFLYWGEVGPDASRDSVNLGPRGHDEVNQARKAGFFGWPYFVANNKAYYKRDFAKQVSYKAFDSAQPVNESPNNTGTRILPPAQPAFIWYPYANSEEFPLVGTGSRNAMAGFVYYADDYKDNPGRFPRYYDKELFTYDWMRGWIMAVTMNEAGDFKSMERFMPSHKFSNPIDMIVSPNGDFYMLEYGEKWNSQNLDARLLHIEYVAGNRKPVSEFEADKNLGAVPLTVQFNAKKSTDFDGDNLTYEWYFENFDSVQASEQNPMHTFEKPGEYSVHLIVKDAKGESAEKAMTILVGNDMPKLAWNIKGNTTFYWDNQPLNYEISVTDKEDGSIGNGIDPSAVAVTIDYLEQGFDANEAAMGHQQVSAFAVGKQLMDKSDCANCHQMKEKSVGPSYLQVAEKYKDDQNAVSYLSAKIINGGNGVWGERAMAAHPKLTPEEAGQMANYILSLGKEAGKKKLPVAATYPLKLHKPAHKEGRYILTASYTDKGGDKIGSLTGSKMVVLRKATIPAYEANALHEVSKFEITPEQAGGLIKEKTELILGNAKGYARYDNIDLTTIKSIILTVLFSKEYNTGGTVEIRLDKPDGEVIATFDATAPKVGLQQITANMKETTGVHDLYIRFDNEKSEGLVLIFLSMAFSQKATGNSF